MRFFLTAILTGLMICAPSIALSGLPPTRSGGQSGSLSTTFDFKAPYNQVTKYSSTGGLIENDYYNILKNPGFEASTYSSNWGVSGGTLAAAATTNIFFSKGATWDSSAASQVLNSDLIAVPEGFKANNCEGSIYIKVPSGTATHLFQVTDGTNILASATVVNSTYFTKNTLTFPCPTSGSIALQIISVASNEPLIAIDEAYLGLARNVGVADLTTEWAATTAITNSWSSNSTYVAQRRRVGDTEEYRIKVSLNSPPSGTLTLALTDRVIDTAKIPNYSSLGNVIGIVKLLDAGTRELPGLVDVLNSTTIQLKAGNSTNGSIDSSVTATYPFSFVSGDTIQIEFSVPIVGWSASQVVMPDAQGWFVAGEITGANPTLGTSAVSTMTEITNSGLTLTAASGSASVGIACANGTTSTIGNTTCNAAAVNESLGFITNVPRAGAYQVCMAYTISGATGNTVTLQVSQTTASSSTPVLNGDQRTSFYNSSTTVAIGSTHRNCSVFNLSAGSNTFRLSYEMDAATNAPGIIADASTSLGQRNFSFYMAPVSSQQQAILANSVSTGTVNGEKLGRALISNGSTANCTASPCTVERNSTGFVSSVTRSATGVYTINFTSGYFSAPPECTYAARDSAAAGSRAFCGLGGASSATAQTIGCYREDTGVASDVFFSIICIGPR